MQKITAINLSSMKKKYLLSLLTAISCSSFCAQQPRLIDQMLAPIGQPPEVNNIIGDYLGGYAPLLNFKIKKSVFSRIFFKVYNTFNHDGSLCAQKMSDDKIIVWNTRTGKEQYIVHSTEPIKDTVYRFLDSSLHTEMILPIAVAFTPSDKYLADISKSKIELRDSKTGVLYKIVPIVNGCSHIGTVSLGNNLLITAGTYFPGERSVNVTNIITGENYGISGFSIAPPFAMHHINNVVLSDSEELVAAHNSEHIEIIDIPSKKIVWQFNTDFTQNSSLAFSPDDKYLVFVCTEPFDAEYPTFFSPNHCLKMYLYEINTKTTKQTGILDTWNGADYQERTMRQLFFTADNQYVIVHAVNLGIKKINITTQKTELLKPGGSSWAEEQRCYKSISPDLRYIATGTNDTLSVSALLSVPKPGKIQKPLSKKLLGDRALFCAFVIAVITAACPLPEVAPFFFILNFVFNPAALSKAEQIFVFMSLLGAARITNPNVLAFLHNYFLNGFTQQK